MGLYAIDRVNWNDSDIPVTRHERKSNPDRDEEIREFAGDNDIAMHWDGTYRDRKSPVGGYDDPPGFTDHPYPDPAEWIAKHLASDYS